MERTTSRNEYNKLETIIGQFQGLATRIKSIKNQLLFKRQRLDREWVGHGSKRFFTEFDQVIIPALNQFEQTQLETARTLQEISRQFLNTEKEASTRIDRLKLRDLVKRSLDRGFRPDQFPNRPFFLLGTGRLKEQQPQNSRWGSSGLTTTRFWPRFRKLSLKRWMEI